MNVQKPITVIEAPSNLGLKSPALGKIPGVHRLPDTLKATGLYSRLEVMAVHRVDAPAYRPEIDAETRIRNAPAIRSYALTLADTVERTLNSNYFPLVIGGDCSILLGSTLALRRIGRYGLLFLDGHTDFQTPATSQTSGAAGMDLALVTGYGPTLLTQIDGYHPLMDTRDVIVLGHRDVVDQATYPAQLIFETDIHLYDLKMIRSLGISHVIRMCLEYFQQRAVSGVWLHLDADVLDDMVMPAVDSRQPDGLSYKELVEIIQQMRSSGVLVGMQITIIDPDLDPDGSVVQQFADHLGNAIMSI